MAECSGAGFLINLFFVVWNISTLPFVTKLWGQLILETLAELFVGRACRRCQQRVQYFSEILAWSLKHPFSALTTLLKILLLLPFLLLPFMVPIVPVLVGIMVPFSSCGVKGLAVALIPYYVALMYLLKSLTFDRRSIWDIFGVDLEPYYTDNDNFRRENEPDRDLSNNITDEEYNDMARHSGIISDTERVVLRNNEPILKAEPVENLAVIVESGSALDEKTREELEHLEELRQNGEISFAEYVKQKDQYYAKEHE